MDAILLIARLSIAAVFLVSAIHKWLHLEPSRQEFRNAKVPFPETTLIGVIGLHLLGSLGLISGIYLSICAYSLAAFILLVTVWVHDFWNRSGEERVAVSRDALANLAIFGGLILLGASGPGDFSFG